ncbi:protein kinase domain-containing protein [Halobacillus salinus]|uniref:Protein kinase family protein n=1 Tax=Halobacillus salinus TaxID=192814 RepID=A0A4Z0GUG8_9BACI|nr:protein kinase [Halobacillus salinus]TGB00804.1 protein kinase family protein [Halobacillus salinus]
MKKPASNLYPGMSVRGKWSGRRYTIIRELGEGACGKVFLCKNDQGDTYALKVGTDSARMMLEVNMLKKFSKVQGVKLGPSFIDVDDWVTNKGTYPFYVMEYIKGESLPSFLKGKTKDWIGVCAIQLLTHLENLHKAGYVFGDLKTDNVLMCQSQLRWIDVGGVTAIGRAIKEYTEFYDRGYWGIGSRRAEPSYDLFAVTMIMMEMAYPHRFEKGAHPRKTLEAKAGSSVWLKPYRAFLLQCWQGKYQDATQMKLALSRIVMKRNKSKSNSSPSRVQSRDRKVRSEKAEMVTISAFVTAFLGLSIYSFWL